MASNVLDAKKGSPKEAETGCCTKSETLSHSEIVETCLPSYSVFVDGHPGWCKGYIRGNYGVYHQYTNGVIIPAFTGMQLCELQHDHQLNDYQISKHLNIKSGLIIYGTDIYVFTPITNNT